MYELVPRIEIQPHEMLFTLCFDVLQLFDGLRGFLYERKHRTRRQLDVSEVFSGFHIFVFVIARNVSTGRVSPSRHTGGSADLRTLGQRRGTR